MRAYLGTDAARFLSELHDRMIPKAFRPALPINAELKLPIVMLNKSIFDCVRRGLCKVLADMFILAAFTRYRWIWANIRGRWRNIALPMERSAFCPPCIAQTAKNTMPW